MKETVLKKPVFWFVMAFVLMPVVAIAVLAAAGKFNHRPVPTLGELESFSLSDRGGDPFSSSQLRSKAWLGAFVSVEDCQGECKAVLGSLKEVQRKFRFKEKFRLVTFSSESREKVAAFFSHHGADPYKWIPLSGEPDEISEVKSNVTSVSSLPPEVILFWVDGWGKIRGVYDGRSPEQLSELMDTGKKLIRKTF